MKRVGELMAELGFREDAPDSLKEALMQGLMKSLTPSEAARVKAKAILAGSPLAGVKQLSFFDEEIPDVVLAKDSGKQAG